MSFSLSFCPTLIVPRPIPPLSSSQLVPLQAPLSRSLSLELYKHSFNGLIRAKYSSPFSHVSSGELRMRIQTMRLSHVTKRKFVSQFPIDYMQLPLRRWKTFPSYRNIGSVSAYAQPTPQLMSEWDQVLPLIQSSLLNASICKDLDLRSLLFLCSTPNELTKGDKPSLKLLESIPGIKQNHF